MAEMSETDDQYLKSKAQASKLSDWDTNLLFLMDSYNTSASYLQVFNQFTTNYQDYGWASSVQSETSSPLANSVEDILGTDHSDTDLSSDVASSSVATDSLNIRPSVKDSIVNSNAFQKVFRSRLDEGRAHVNASHFSNLHEGQPFINDYGVPYTDLLGKNRVSYYATPAYTNSLKSHMNQLSSVYALSNTQAYEFPFMDAVKSDLIRYTWLDGYAKWANIDVQPASVSRYSTLGVPYLRKPYDFNTAASDSFSDVQNYFTRASRNRKNYLPNWHYSALTFNRQAVNNHVGGLTHLLSPSNLSISSLFTSLEVVSNARNLGVYQLNHLNSLMASNSGVSVYSKSTWRPQASVAAYHHNVTTFVDLLSRREILLRDYWFKQSGSVYLPKKLTASPQNPLLKEVIAAFALHDPLTFSSEASRDYVYFSLSYFKFLHMKSLVRSAVNLNNSLPVSLPLLNDYIFYFFMNNSNETMLPTSNTLYKDQFRPLRKGVSNLLRLHATGAVAMPIELRLQILASSKDVIHSWAIPSAGIKIDCIPGYTSHRIMKFMLTGIYWGQCQEICGRYHHWMPIVVYFINRDLFFLWCTHFIYKPQTQNSWEISDRKFANFVRFVSYDKSSWLSEVSTL